MAWKGFDKDRYQQERDDADQGSGSDFFTFEEGDTLLYVAEPCRDDDSLNFVEVKQHDNGFGAGINHICLNPAKNKVLEHPALIEALAARNEGEGLDISDGCPTCQRQAAGQLKEAGKIKLKSRYFWNIIPIKFRADPRAPFKAVSPADQVRPCPTSYTLWDGIMDQYANEGNISDPDAAILLKVTREGTQKDTEYTVGLDTETVRKPMKLSDEARAALGEALQPGGPGDLYRIVASMVKSPAEIADQLDGDGKKGSDKGKVATTKTGGAPKAEKSSAAPGKASKKPAGAPPCYANDCSPQDRECQECPHKAPCAAACGVEEPVLTSVKPFVKPEKAPAKGPARIKASDAEEDASYLLDGGEVMTFTGTAKGKFFFDNDDGERKALTADALITPVKAEEPKAAAEPEKKKAAPKQLTVADAKKGAWYTVGDDATPRQFVEHKSIKGVDKGLFDDEDSNRISATLEVAIALVEATGKSEEKAAEEEPPMPEGAAGGDDDEAAMAELEAQLNARKKKAK